VHSATMLDDDKMLAFCNFDLRSIVAQLVSNDIHKLVPVIALILRLFFFENRYSPRMVDTIRETE